MKRIISNIWGRVNKGRALGIAVLAPAVASILFMWVAAQGDSDLPPYDPPTGAERCCSIAASVIVWPAVVAARTVGLDGHQTLFWPLFLSSGLFWAIAVEWIALAKNAHKA